MELQFARLCGEGSWSICTGHVQPNFVLMPSIVVPLGGCGHDIFGGFSPPPGCIRLLFFCHAPRLGCCLSHFPLYSLPVPKMPYNIHTDRQLVKPKNLCSSRCTQQFHVQQEDSAIMLSTFFHFYISFISTRFPTFSHGLHSLDYSMLIILTPHTRTYCWVGRWTLSFEWRSFHSIKAAC